MDILADETKGLFDEWKKSEEGNANVNFLGNRKAFFPHPEEHLRQLRLPCC
jgi:hypothetical protein